MSPPPYGRGRVISRYRSAFQGSVNGVPLPVPVSAPVPVVLDGSGSWQPDSSTAAAAATTPMLTNLVRNVRIVGCPFLVISEGWSGLRLASRDVLHVVDQVEHVRSHVRHQQRGRGRGKDEAGEHEPLFDLLPGVQ